MASPMDLYKIEEFQNLFSKSRTPSKSPMQIDIENPFSIHQQQLLLPPPNQEQKPLLLLPPPQPQQQAQSQQLILAPQAQQHEQFIIDEEIRRRSEFGHLELIKEQKKQWNALREMQAQHSNNQAVKIDSNNIDNSITILGEKRQFQFTPNVPDPKHKRLLNPQQLEYQQEQQNQVSSQQRFLLQPSSQSEEDSVGDERDSDLDERIRRRNIQQINTEDESDIDKIDNKDRLIQQHQEGGDINKLIEQLGQVSLSMPKNADPLEFDRFDYEKKKYYVEHTNYDLLDTKRKREWTRYKKAVLEYEFKRRPIKKDLSQAHAFNPNFNKDIPPEQRAITLKKKEDRAEKSKVYQTRALTRQQQAETNERAQQQQLLQIQANEKEEKAFLKQQQKEKADANALLLSNAQHFEPTRLRLKGRPPRTKIKPKSARDHDDE
jgi:hypothetical protein